MEFWAHYRKDDDELQPVKQHLLKTAIFAKENSGKIKLPLFGELMGLLHDIGKYSDSFQKYFLSGIGKITPDMDGYVNATALKGKIDHSTSGAQFAWNSYGEHIQQLTAQIISLCIASHHGKGLLDCLTIDGCDSFTKRISKNKELTFFDEVSQKLDKEILGRVNTLIHSGKIEKELEDRLQSLFSKDNSKEINQFLLSLLTRFIFSVLIDADRTDSANFENPSRIKLQSNDRPWDKLIDKLENHINGFETKNSIDEVRRNISSLCYESAFRKKGSYLLTAPTGGGKTLASLRFALHHAKKHTMDRIIYVIPYTSIIDQNATVARSIFQDGNKGRIVLEHHSNLTLKNDTEENQILSENWNAPIVFTTMVQFLETLFSSGTRGARRMHQLANSVIIFDEIQTLPVKAVHLFNNAINFLVGQCGATTLFCTATQPLLDKVDVQKGAVKLSTESNIATLSDKMLGECRRVQVINKCKAGGWSDDEIADCALGQMDKNGSVLVIVNTKTTAKNIYRLCRKKTQQKIFHLSTNMCPVHRRIVFRKINRCLNPKNSKPVICISTQLIEAGVDIDFGCVMRSMAGLDSIAQAAGRCNRHGRCDMGQVIIINPANENIQKLEDIRIGREKTERFLGEYKANPNSFGNDIIGKKAMDRYYKYYFFDRAGVMDYPVPKDKIGRDDTIFSLLSTNYQSVEAYKRNEKKAPQICLRQAFKSAGEAFRVIDAPTEGVIVPYRIAGKFIINKLRNANGIKECNALLKRAQRYSVNLFPYHFKKLNDKGYICEVQPGSGIMYLDERFYSDEFGVSLEPVSDMPFLYS